METATLTAPPAGMISLSPAALAKVREMLATQPNAEELYLRLGVKGGGCSGFSYHLEFDTDIDTKYDRIFEFEEVKVVVDRKSLLYLAGMTLNYTGDLHFVGEGGFEFVNPNASKTCGCGTSFQA